MGPVKKSGQAATEYLMTAAVIGIMILPAAYLFYSYSSKTGDEIDQAQIDRLGREITGNAEKIYFQGPPSRIELEERLPKGIQNITILGDWGSRSQQLVFYTRVERIVSDFSFPTAVNINGSFNGSLNEITNSPGTKKIAMEAYEMTPGPDGSTTTFVHINFGGRCPISTTVDYNTDGVVDATDTVFYSQCYCGTPNHPKYRPNRAWKDGWFNNGGDFGGNPYGACINLDYDGDCQIDQADATLACSRWGALCGAPPLC